MRIRSNKGFTLIELLIVVAIVSIIITTILYPRRLRARMSGNEASAIGSLRAINSAQQAYSSSCANGFYADVLTDLALAPVGGKPFISPDLGASNTVVKNGYTVILDGTIPVPAATLVACNTVAAAALAASYVATAAPTSSGSTGVRFFWTNTRGTIYTNTAATWTGGTGVAPPSTGAPLR